MKHSRKLKYKEKRKTHKRKIKGGVLFNPGSVALSGLKSIAKASTVGVYKAIRNALVTTWKWNEFEKSFLVYGHNGQKTLKLATGEGNKKVYQQDIYPRSAAKSKAQQQVMMKMFDVPILRRLGITKTVTASTYQPIRLGTLFTVANNKIVSAILSTLLKSKTSDMGTATHIYIVIKISKNETSETGSLDSTETEGGMSRPSGMEFREIRLYQREYYIGWRTYKINSWNTAMFWKSLRVYEIKNIFTCEASSGGGSMFNTVRRTLKLQRYDGGGSDEDKEVECKDGECDGLLTTRVVSQSSSQNTSSSQTVNGRGRGRGRVPSDDASMSSDANGHRRHFETVETTTGASSGTANSSSSSIRNPPPVASVPRQPSTDVYTFNYSKIIGSREEIKDSSTGAFLHRVETRLRNADRATRNVTSGAIYIEINQPPKTGLDKQFLTDMGFFELFEPNPLTNLKETVLVKTPLSEKYRQLLLINKQGEFLKPPITVQYKKNESGTLGKMSVATYVDTFEIIEPVDTKNPNNGIAMITYEKRDVTGNVQTYQANYRIIKNDKELNKWLDIVRSYLIQDERSDLSNHITNWRNKSGDRLLGLNYEYPLWIVFTNQTPGNKISSIPFKFTNFPPLPPETLEQILAHEQMEERRALNQQRLETDQLEQANRQKEKALSEVAIEKKKSEEENKRNANLAEIEKAIATRFAGYEWLDIGGQKKNRFTCQTKPTPPDISTLPLILKNPTATDILSTGFLPGGKDSTSRKMLRKFMLLIIYYRHITTPENWQKTSDRKIKYDNGQIKLPTGDADIQIITQQKGHLNFYIDKAKFLQGTQEAEGEDIPDEAGDQESPDTFDSITVDYLNGANPYILSAFQYDHNKYREEQEKLLSAKQLQKDQTMALKSIAKTSRS